MAEDNNFYDFTMLLLLASRTTTDHLLERLNGAGFEDVRPAHGFVFLRLSHGEATGQELAQYLDITKQAASQMIEYLEQHGYVERQPSPGDARNKLVRLTARGWQCIEATERILSNLQTEWANLLGPARLATLREDLEKIILQSNGGTWPGKLRPNW